MHRRTFARGLFGLGAVFGIENARAEPEQAHRAVFQVDSDDRRTQAMVLRNVANYAKHYREKKQAFTVALVVFGPGYGMVRADMSMMKGPIEDLQHELGDRLIILACHNTRAAIAESEGKKPGDIPLVAGVEETPSGVVAIAEYQERRWAYVRP